MAVPATVCPEPPILRNRALARSGVVPQQAESLRQPGSPGTLKDIDDRSRDEARLVKR